MNTTGIRPRMSHRLALALALGALTVGVESKSYAELQDPTKPRVERVKDVDGSIWEVQIVPRPLYRPQIIACPPAHRESTEAPAVPAPAPDVDPMKSPYDTKPKKKKNKPAKEESANGPASAEKPLALLSETELIALQDDSKKKKADKKNEAKGKAEAKREDGPENNFGVDIVPRFIYPAQGPAEIDCAPEMSAPCLVHPASYDAIYESIPFRRSEYIANPSYRHEATMEILFGKLRPTVVHKHPGQPRPHGTLFPYENGFVRPYSYYSLAPGTGYGRGPLPFATPGAYGVNYNFYYPMPTVYRSY